MTREDLYETWAGRLRERYRSRLQTAPPAPQPRRLESASVSGPGVGPLPEECAALRGQVAAAAEAVRSVLVAAAAECVVREQAAAVDCVRGIYPNFFHGDPTPQQLASRLSRENEDGILAEYRCQLLAHVEEARVLALGGADDESRCAALEQSRADLVTQLDALRARLAGQHRVGPAAFAGLEAVKADPTFRSLCDRLLADARLERSWNLDRGVFDRFRTPQTAGPPGAPRPSRSPAPGPAPGRSPARTESRAPVPSSDAGGERSPLSLSLGRVREAERARREAEEVPPARLQAHFDRVLGTHRKHGMPADGADLFPILDPNLRVGILPLHDRVPQGLAELAGRFADEWLTPELVETFAAATTEYTARQRRTRERAESLSAEVAGLNDHLHTMSRFGELLDNLEPGVGNPSEAPRPKM